MSPDDPEVLAYVGLGSNLGERLSTLEAVVDQLRRGAISGTTLLRGSPVFETRPLGPTQGPYLNAVVEVRTSLAPPLLLDGLLALEARHGRTRRERWGPRTLDLDLLLVTRDHASLALALPRLQLPHPELARRDFVLTPLATLRPDLRPHGNLTVHELLVALPEAERTIIAQARGPLC